MLLNGILIREVEKPPLLLKKATPYKFMLGAMRLIMMTYLNSNWNSSI